MKPKPVYVVRRLSWAGAYEPKDGFAVAGGGESEQPGVPVKGFATQAAAEAFCREQEAQARAVVPPGRVLTGDVTPKTLTAGIAKLGLTPPKFPHGCVDGAVLLRWWESVAAGATPEQRAGVWNLLGGVRFFDVVEATLTD